MKFKLILLFFIIFVSKIKPMEELMLSSVLVEDQAEDESKNSNDNIIKKVKSFVVSQWYKSDLWEAILANDFEACNKALQNGANPNSLIFDNRYWWYNVINGIHSIFARACFKKNINIRIIKLLIQYGADVNYSNGFVTPLQIVLNRICYRNYNLAKVLLENGADPNIKTYEYSFSDKEFYKFYQDYLFNKKYTNFAKENLNLELDHYFPKGLQDIIFNYYIDKNITIDKMQKDLNIK